jgi:hypothetical protein
MAPNEPLSELRRKYRSAYTEYMHCVHELADSSQRGKRPTDQIAPVRASFRSTSLALRRRASRAPS